LGGRGRRISEFEASLVYKVSSRTARATQRNPVSKRKEREREREKRREEKRREEKRREEKRREEKRREEKRREEKRGEGQVITKDGQLADFSTEKSGTSDCNPTGDDKRQVSATHWKPGNCLPQ
jgi:hypothetical protein